MATIKKANNGVKQKPKPKPITGPTFVNLRMANEKTKTGLPATRQDSLDYKRGWLRGLKGDKPSAMEKKYQGENEYEKMGRWEGQNKGKKSSVKKAKNGTSLGMKSVKVGFDKNSGITRADVIVAAKKKPTKQMLQQKRKIKSKK
jgi:hypothetical protein